jgi:type IV secretory pathway TrbL component
MAHVRTHLEQRLKSLHKTLLGAGGRSAGGGTGVSSRSGGTGSAGRSGSSGGGAGGVASGMKGLRDRSGHFAISVVMSDVKRVGFKDDMKKAATLLGPYAP